MPTTAIALRKPATSSRLGPECLGQPFIDPARVGAAPSGESPKRKCCPLSRRSGARAKHREGKQKQTRRPAFSPLIRNVLGAALCGPHFCARRGILFGQPSEPVVALGRGCCIAAGRTPPRYSHGCRGGRVKAPQLCGSIPLLPFLARCSFGCF
jgi:hypothetical protein